MNTRNGSAWNVVRGRAILGAVLLSVWGAGWAAITVPADYPSIQAAIDAAAAGEEVIVEPGVYDEHVDFKGKNIVLRSTDPRNTSVVEATVIRVSDDGDVVTFRGTETPECVLSGFTLTRAMATTGRGIGGGGTLATIQYNRIVDAGYTPQAASTGYEGIHDCDGLIHGNLVEENVMGIRFCDGVVQCNRVLRNVAGGGIRECDGVIQNNLVAGNQRWAFPPFIKTYGAGIYDCSGLVVNNTVTGNRSDFGSGICDCRGVVAGNIVWDNEMLRIGRGIANVTEDPKFVDSAGGDYRLQAGSPAVDAGLWEYFQGTRIVDLDENLRWTGSAVDAGCFEYDSEADTDGDLLADSQEASRNTNAGLFDTDGDGLGDGLELVRGTDPTVANSASGLTVPSQQPTIQRALALAFRGETVTALPGTYHETLEFPGRELVLQSSDPENDGIVGSTVIDGDGASWVLRLNGNETDASAVRGLTLRNGKLSGIQGRGSRATLERLRIEQNEGANGGGISASSGFIHRCTIRQNSGYFGGGVHGCDGFLGDCLIENNTAQYGGGVADFQGDIWNSTISGNSANSGGGLQNCLGTFHNNRITSNTATYQGGGMEGCSGVMTGNYVNFNAGRLGGGLANCPGDFLDGQVVGNRATTEDQNLASGGGGFYSFTGRIQRSVIAGNSASSDGGGLAQCQGLVANNFIYANTSTASGGGIAIHTGRIVNNSIHGNTAGNQGGGVYSCQENRNNIVWANTSPANPQLSGTFAPAYSCIQDWAGGGSGNITDDPLFVNAAKGNLRLTAGSPCIDAGGFVAGVNDDIDGDPRPMDSVGQPRGDGSEFDIGADEATGVVLPAYCTESDFEASKEGWFGIGSNPAFITPGGGWSDGALVIHSTDNTDTFGFWGSPAFVLAPGPDVQEPNAIELNGSLDAGALYLFSARVRSDVGAPTQAPTLRLRASTGSFERSDILVATSTGNGGFSPATDGRTYNHLFPVPVREGLFRLYYEMLNFDGKDAADARFFLDSYSLSTVYPAGPDREEGVMDFSSGAGGWTPRSAETFLSPVFESGAEGLTLRGVADSAAPGDVVYGYWGSPEDGANPIVLEAGRVYTARFTVTTDAAAGRRANVPTFRARMNDSTLRASAYVNIESKHSRSEVPVAGESVTYDVRLVVPQALAGGKLLFALDYLYVPGGDHDPTLGITLESVEVRSAPFEAP